MLASLSAIGLFFVIGAGPSSIVSFAISSVHSSGTFANSFFLDYLVFNDSFY